MLVQDLSKADHLHHAYIVSGVPANTGGEVVAMLKARGVETVGNTDLLTFTYNEVLVDDARQIAQYAFLKSVGVAKYFVIVFDKMGDAAQNALLKVIEEAPGNTHFFFCVQSPGYLLGTVRSRCIEVRGGTHVELDTGVDAHAFLQSSYADRLSIVEKMVKVLQKTHDRTPARSLVRALVTEAHDKKVGAKALRSLMTADSYLRLNGSSPKVVLSHLALTLPVL